MAQTNSALTTWLQDISLPEFPKLVENHEAEVVIIGGGLTGLLSAYLLAKEGKRIVLIEKKTIGSGVTARTTGFLTQCIDTNLSDIIWMFGEEKAKQVVRSHGEAVDLIEKIVKDEEIDCEFIRCDDVVFADTGAEGDVKMLREEQAAASTLGIESILEPQGVLSFANAGALHVKNQAKFHPLKFLAGLANAAQKAGARLYEQTEASSIEHDDRGVTVQAGLHTIRADYALSASYEPFAEPWGLYFKKAMYVSYVIELRAPKNSVPEATYEDTENPYHYFRVDSMDTHDRIIIGGEDHRQDVHVSRKKNFARLEVYIAKTFSNISYSIVRRWSGRVLEPIDGVAFIGPYQDKRTWYAFGFSGNGMTYAAITAILFQDAVLGRENSWGGIYDVARVPGGKSLWVKGRDFAGEFVHGALSNTFAHVVESKPVQK